MKIALFPGSFDPFTLGHYEIARRALTIFDKLVIAVGVNPNKSGFLSPMNRRCLIEDIFAKDPRVVVRTYESLTTELCVAERVTHIVRGLRNSEDLEFERSIEIINKGLCPQVETIYLLTAPEHLHISSSVIRELHSFDAPTDAFLPAGVRINDYL